MAAPTVFNVAVTNPGGTGSTITVNLSTHAVDDILYINVGNTGNVLWTGNPSGWSRLDQRSVGTSTTGIVGTWLYRRVLSGDSLPLPNPVCTLGATVTRGAICRTVRGADLEGIFTLPEWGARGFSTGTANPVRPPSVTTPAPEMLVLHCYSQRSATNAPDPAGYTQDQEIIISGTLVLNAASKTVADQNTVLSNQDASPTSGVRWAAGIVCIPSPNYPYFRSSTSTTATATSVTGTLPAGTTDSSGASGRADGMLAIVKAAGNGVSITADAAWANVTGWTLETSTGSDSIEVFSTEYAVGRSLVFSRPAAGIISVQLLTYHNIHQTAFIGNSSARQNAGTPAPWDAQARQNTKSTVVAIIVADADTNNVHSIPAGWIERTDGLGIGSASQSFDASGTTASANWTTTNAANVAGLIELLSYAGSAPSAAELIFRRTSFGQEMRLRR